MATEAAPKSDPMTVQEQTFTGSIKFYSPYKGFGFITCEQIEGDLFFFHRNLSKEIIEKTQYEGCDLDLKQCSFTVGVTPEGKPCAKELTILEELEPGTCFKGKGGKWGMFMGFDPYGMGMKGFGLKGKGKTAHQIPGTPLTDERVQGQMKSYSSNGSKWGFATATTGDWGDIFVHMNNMNENHPMDVCLRVGDIIEMNLEEVTKKPVNVGEKWVPVAKNVILIPQDPSVYTGQFIKGTVASFNEEDGNGTITAVRVVGPIPFHKDECPTCMEGNYENAEVMCRIVVGPDGKAKGVNVNPLWGMDYAEGIKRSQEVIDALSADGYIDDTAKNALYPTDPNELLAVLPELDLAKADNPSSFILGALTRQRWEDWYMYGPMMWFKGKGKGMGMGGMGGMGMGGMGGMGMGGMGGMGMGMGK